MGARKEVDWLFRPQNCSLVSLVHLSSVSSNVGTVLPTAEMSPPQVCEMPFKYFVAYASDSPPLATGQTLVLPISWERFGSGGDFFQVLLIHYHQQVGTVSRAERLKSKAVSCVMSTQKSPCSHEHASVSWLPRTQMLSCPHNPVRLAA